MSQTVCPVSLVKLCVGVQEIAQLEESVERARKANRPMSISTRLMPKRREELLNGGSLYWVISGKILVRQAILKMELGTTELGSRVIIDLHPELVLTEPHPRRPFQGWRYLNAGDTPGDLKQNITTQRLPPHVESDIKAALAW